VSRRVRLAGLLYGAAVVVYGLDRLTKLLAERHLAGRPPIVLIPRVLDLSYTTNAGGAFGLFGGQPWLFFAATLVVCVAIAVASARLSSSPSALGLGLILGGALGNLTDRILRGPGVSGRVVDFIDFRIWPVFNLADSAIVLGGLIILLAGLRREPAAEST
jgi:signal peptidase II